MAWRRLGVVSKRACFCALILAYGACFKKKLTEEGPWLYSGCRAVFSGHVCEVQKGDVVTLWVPYQPSDSWAVKPASGVDVLEQRGVLEGLSWKIRFTQRFENIEIKKNNAVVYTLHVRMHQAPAWIEKTDTLRREGLLEKAHQAMPLEKELVQKRDHIFWHAKKGRLFLAQQQFQEALWHLKRTGALGFKEGLLSEACQALLVQVYVYVYAQEDHEKAQGVYEEFLKNCKQEPESYAVAPYYMGRLFLDTGHIREAVEAFSSSAEAARKIGFHAQWQASQQMLAETWSTAGRHEEASGVFESLVQEPALLKNPCVHADALTNQAWHKLLWKEAGFLNPSLTHVHSVLEKAIALYETSCADHEKWANAYTNKALAYVQEQHFQHALKWLEKARETSQQPVWRMKIWWMDIEARVALYNKSFSYALELYQTMALFAEKLQLKDVAWRSYVGKGAVFMRMHRDAQAVEMFTQAEKVLDAHSFQLPSHEGRGHFLSDRSLSAQGKIKALLRLGFVEKALLVARKARVRSLRGRVSYDVLTPAQSKVLEHTLYTYQKGRAALEKEVANDWQWSEQQWSAVQVQRRKQAETLEDMLEKTYAALSPEGGQKTVFVTPEPQSCWVLYFAMDALNHIGFAWNAHHVWTHAFSDLKKPLLNPFSECLEKAQKVHFLTHGQTHRIDFHALLWKDNQPLLKNKTVVYGMDIAPSKIKKIPFKDAHVHVVSDPSGDLPHAREEGMRVYGVLKNILGHEHVKQHAGAEADYGTVLKAVSHADVLHFAGHGMFDGLEGYSSALRVAQGASVRVGDVLALKNVPAYVVLSGCETGKTDLQVWTQTMGLAQAFVLAGSHAVVASVKPVQDVVAARMMVLMYQTMLRTQSWDLAEALREVQTTMPDQEVWKFRTIVP
jgi:tetratricopeptide (TPR) repeat protein